MSDGLCPCGSGASYRRCCWPIHERGAGLGTTAEQLMRARYSAYALDDERFVLESWHPDTRPASLAAGGPVTWTGLDVVDTHAGTAFDNTGTVSFVARFTRDGLPLELEETSSFVRVDGQWRYLSGE